MNKLTNYDLSHHLSSFNITFHSQMYTPQKSFATLRTYSNNKFHSVDKNKKKNKNKIKIKNKNQSRNRDNDAYLPLLSSL